MADSVGLTADEEMAVVWKYGSVDNAIDKAVASSSELAEIYDERFTWSLGSPNDVAKFFWRRALPVLGIYVGSDTNAAYAGPDVQAAPKPASRQRGPKPDFEWKGWPRDPLDKIVELRATRHWGRHTIAEQVGVKGRISERQVGHIMKKVDAGALIWDQKHRRTTTGPSFELKPGPADGTVVLASR